MIILNIWVKAKTNTFAILLKCISQKILSYNYLMKNTGLNIKSEGLQNV